MSGIRFVKIGSRDRSRILMYARRRAALHAPHGYELPISLKDRVRREQVGLSGEFAVAMNLRQKLEFIEYEDGQGDGGVDFWNHGTSIDVKAESPRRPGAPVRAYPVDYRADVIVFVRQMKPDNFEGFEILGWRFATEVKRMTRQGDYVDICLCRLRPIEYGLPPNDCYSMPDPRYCGTMPGVRRENPSLSAACPH